VGMDADSLFNIFKYYFYTIYTPIELAMSDCSIIFYVLTVLLESTVS